VMWRRCRLGGSSERASGRASSRPGRSASCLPPRPCDHRLSPGPALSARNDAPDSELDVWMSCWERVSVQGEAGLETKGRGSGWRGQKGEKSRRGGATMRVNALGLRRDERLFGWKVPRAGGKGEALESEGRPGSMRDLGVSEGVAGLVLARASPSRARWPSVHSVAPARTKGFSCTRSITFSQDLCPGSPNPLPCTEETDGRGRPSRHDEGDPLG
jgi:hypothetical protein